LESAPKLASGDGRQKKGFKRLKTRAKEIRIGVTQTQKEGILPHTVDGEGRWGQERDQTSKGGGETARFQFLKSAMGGRVLEGARAGGENKKCDANNSLEKGAKKKGADWGMKSRENSR